jgi:hypothetical protein
VVVGYPAYAAIMARLARGSATYGTDERWHRARRVLRALDHWRRHFFARRHPDHTAPRARLA